VTHTRTLASLLALSLLVPALISAGEQPGTPFTHADSGATFVVPEGLAHDAKSSRDKPFSAAFTKGKPPFSSSVLFKEVSKELTLEAWTKEEKARWKKGGYEKEVTLSSVKVGEQKAVMILRKSRFGELHYLVFASPKNKRLYAFWHMTSKTADPKKVCAAALQSMAKSLKFKKAKK
jgi:hypothetical protein